MTKIKSFIIFNLLLFYFLLFLMFVFLFIIGIDPVYGIPMSLPVLMYGIFIKYFISQSQKKMEREKRIEDMRRAEIRRAEIRKYEEEQREKGLIKFIGSDRREKWGTPEQVKKWREIDIGLSNNFADYSPYEFEKFIAELFSRMGYKTEVTSKVKDYGVDVVAKKGENTVAIQVKKFSKGNNVGAKEVQQILGAMWKVKADQSIIITTTGFTVYAREQAKEAPVELWDKKRLHEMVRRYFIDIDT